MEALLRSFGHKLARPSLLSKGSLIGGREVSGGKVYDIVDPGASSQTTIHQVAECTDSQIGEAVQSGKEALREWSMTDPMIRSEIFEQAEELVRRNKTDLSLIIAAEGGKLLKEAEGEVDNVIGTFEHYAKYLSENADRLVSERLARNREVRWTPLGVVGMLTPWNFPMSMVSRKVAAALAAGCTAVVKPDPRTPLSALALASILQDAGFPAGTLNVLVSEDPARVASQLCAHPSIAKVSFTGSTAVGRIIAQQAAPKPVTLELGGRAPFILFADAGDVDVAVRDAAQSRFRHSGQTCLCVNRLLVEDEIYEQVVDKVKALMGEYKIGHQLNPSVTLGPLISASAKAQVGHQMRKVDPECKYTADVPVPAGNYLAPSVFLKTVADEEIFGPVLSIQPFKDPHHALSLAADSPYGLAGYVYSSSKSNIALFRDNLPVGMLGINTTLLSDPQTVFGGVGASGHGREGHARFAIREYQYPKYCLTG